LPTVKSPISFLYIREVSGVSRIALAATIALLGWALTSPAWLAAATPAEKRLSMEQRLTESDIAVALKHYERVCTELLDTRLRKTLTESEPAAKPAEKEAQLRLIAQKIALLEQHSKNLREELLKAGRIDVTTRQ
jgi:hypothetical protein